MTETPETEQQRTGGGVEGTAPGEGLTEDAGPEREGESVEGAEDAPQAE